MQRCRDTTIRYDPRWKIYPEELIVYGLLIGTGAIPVVNAIVEHAAFGVEATIGLIMVCAGLLGVFAWLWRVLARREPGAGGSVAPQSNPDDPVGSEISGREAGGGGEHQPMKLTDDRSGPRQPMQRLHHRGHRTQGERQAQGEDAEGVEIEL